MSRLNATLFTVIICLIPVLRAGAVANDPIPLAQRYVLIRKAAERYGPGGLEVLEVAYRTLKQSQNSSVGIEDLWTAALKEGKTLFGHAYLWQAISPKMTKDMLGQTSVGPWQITLGTARKFYPAKPLPSSDTELVKALEQHPDIQCLIATRIFEKSYRSYGKRNPLAIQDYFWLEAFRKKQIGQGPWYASVLPPNAQERIQTGFYAKQFLLGSRFNPEGLLYWLYITGDVAAIQDTLKEWNEAGYSIEIDDLSHCSCDGGFQNYLRRLLVLQ